MCAMYVVCSFIDDPNQYELSPLHGVSYLSCLIFSSFYNFINSIFFLSILQTIGDTWQVLACIYTSWRYDFLRRWMNKTNLQEIALETIKCVFRSLGLKVTTHQGPWFLGVYISNQYSIYQNLCISTYPIVLS